MSSKSISDMRGDLMTGHKRKDKTKERIMSSYWWPGIDTEIDIHIKSCDKCQKNRKEKEAVPPLQVPFPVF
jgi:hypothetical protein